MSDWKLYLKNKKFTISLILIIILLIATLSFFSRFLIYVENRPGFSFDDPILKLFSAIDLNLYIFPLIYLSILSGLIILAASPEDFFTAILAYVMLNWVRMLLMYVMPLNTPIGTIDLQDPLVFILGAGQKITKDLFFSGHTATLFLIFLAVKNKKMKIIYLIATLIVGLFVMLQKAHYSADVFTALFVSYSVYKISGNIFRVLFKKESKR